MIINFTKWDKYPGAFLALPIAIMIYVYFRHAITSQIDDPSLIRIAFFAALCAIGFTFWCKWEEEENKLQRKKEHLERILQLQKHATDKSEYYKTNEKLNNVIEQIKNIKKKHAEKTQTKLNELKITEKNLGGNDKKHLKALNKIEKLGRNLEKKLGIEGPNGKKDTHSGQLLIFAALYAIIGGLAVTQAVTVFSDPDKNNYIDYAHNFEGFIQLVSSKPAFVIASFFSVGILFIHCGIIFLSTDGRKIISEGNKAGFFISSLLVFLEGVVLFYAGNAVDNLLNFVFWIFMLMAIDIVWVVVNIFKDIDVLVQWLYLDSIMFIFLLTILLMFHSVSQVPKEVYGYVLIIFLARTIADYKMGWKTVWGKFDVSDKWS